MKKTFTILIAVLTLLTMITLPRRVWADNEVINCASSSPYFSGTNFTISYGKTSGNDPAYNSTDAGLRLYVNNYITITPKNGETITAVTLTVKCNKGGSGNNAAYPTGVTVNTGSITAGATPGNNVTSVVWSGSTTTALTFTVNGAKGNVAVKSISITYSPAAPAYIITAKSNNTDYGTVSLNGSVITGEPKSGYRYASQAYTVDPANSATVSQNGNEFTVTPSANTTVTINFEPIPTHTATFSINGNTSQTATIAEGASITFPSNISAVYGKPFVGWVSAAIDGTTDDEPEFVTSATMSTADVTFYAVFATATAGDPVETKTQTLQYDTWTKGGSSTDKPNNSYRLFHNGGYVESSSFDLSKLSKVIVYGGTFGGDSYNSLNIGDGTNTWKNVTVTGSSQTGENTYTNGNALSGTKALRVKSTCGSTDGNGSGIRMSKVEIYTMETSYIYSAYCTTVQAPAVIQPEITVEETFFFSTTVSISCETEGASIKYSFDNETWNDYEELFTITETKTIYAKAVKDAVESTTAHATATKQQAEPTVTIITSGITNKNVHSGTAAGTLSATVTYNEAAIGGASVTWGGDDDDVATINSATGAVTLVAAGSVTFTATYAGNTDYSSKTATYTMVVINVDPSAPSYTLVTSTSQIIPGAHYVLSSSKTKDATAYIMDEQSGTYRLTETATILEDNEDGRIYIQKSSLYEFVISGFTDNYTIYDETNGTPGYLYHTSDKSVGVTNTLSNSGKWKITFDNDKAIINNFGSQTYYLEFNTSANPKRVTDYAGTQPDGYLYIKDSDPDIHPYSSSEYTSGSVTINDAITLSENYNITVGAGATLTFTGTLSCDNPAWLVVEEGGQLIIPAAKDDVQATFQRKVVGYGSSTDKDKYILLANPTTGSIKPEDVDGMLDDNYDLYYFDEAQTGAEWRNYKKVTFNLVNGNGYLYANSSDITLNLAGVVPTGTSSSVTLNKEGNGTYKGFNLVGNPMSVNITSMNIGGSGCSYYKLHSSTGVFEASDAPIIVGEAFMVEATNDGDVLTLTPTSKGERDFNNDVIRLEVSNNKYKDVAFLYFGNHLPLTKINHLNDEAPMIYIHNESANQAVAVMNERSEVKTVNVNFEAKTMGSYTISAKAEKGNFSYMHLYDRLTGVDTDMLENDYTFIGAKEDAAGRFILSFEAVDTDTENEIFAYQSGNNIYVNGEGELQIFDITGRFVMSERINGATSINADALSKGVYVLRIIGSEIKTQKIVVR